MFYKTLHCQWLFNLPRAAVSMAQRLIHAAVLHSEPGGSRHAAPSHCRRLQHWLQSLKPTKMWRGLSSFLGKLQTLAGNCSLLLLARSLSRCLSFLLGRSPRGCEGWQFSGLLLVTRSPYCPLIGWCHANLTLTQLPATADRCSDVLAKFERGRCTFRVTNHVWSDGCITIWHTNILSQHNINQPTRLKNASAKVSEKSRAWCHQIQAMTDSRPPSQHSVQQHSKPRPSLLRPCAASLGQANCSNKKMAKWCIPVPVQTASCQLRVEEEWLKANMTNYPQVVKLDTN